MARKESYHSVIPLAEILLKEPIPQQPDNLYLDFSRTGNRTHWQKVCRQRRDRIKWLVLAECLENKGRFLEAIEEIVHILCSERTWVMPAHDRDLANFKGERIDIDLGSARLAWNLATADYLLGNKLSSDTRKLIRDNISCRIFEPFRDMATGKREANWWFSTTNNWNAVCLASVTGSALALLESRQDRALFVGDKGKLTCSWGGQSPRLIPETKMKAYKRPAKSLPRTKGHHMDWLEACKGGKEAGSNFDIAGPLTEAVLLGNVAIRTGKKLIWDGPNMKVTNVPEANKYINPPYRQGWSL